MTQSFKRSLTRFCAASAFTTDGQLRNKSLSVPSSLSGFELCHFILLCTSFHLITRTARMTLARWGFVALCLFTVALGNLCSLDKEFAFFRLFYLFLAQSARLVHVSPSNPSSSLAPPCPSLTLSLLPRCVCPL